MNVYNKSKVYYKNGKEVKRYLLVTANISDGLTDEKT